MLFRSLRLPTLLNLCIQWRGCRGVPDEELGPADVELLHVDSRGCVSSLLASSAALIDEAAADTVTTTLNVTLYHLLSKPEYLARLQAELDEAFPNNEPIVYEPLIDLPFLKYA